MKKKKQLKLNKLQEIVTSFESKAHNTHTLIYAGSYDSSVLIGNTISSIIPIRDSQILRKFSCWLVENYSADLPLVEFICRGIGIHMVNSIDLYHRYRLIYLVIIP